MYVFSGGTDPSLLSLPDDDQQEVQRIGVRLRAGIACVDFVFYNPFLLESASKDTTYEEIADATAPAPGPGPARQATALH